MLQLKDPSMHAALKMKDSVVLNWTQCSQMNFLFFSLKKHGFQNQAVSQLESRSQCSVTS